MKLIKILNSKWFDAFPAVIMAAVAIGEGSLYWLAGVGLIIWLFALAVRHLVGK